ncbi:MAG: aspartate carbamoyltransferase catalytic subunit [Coriobacteriales bacterium]|nr:aspartate carbamoyltransferase catalytic subunit [Coriobacteriaceae bacterium]MDY2722526.1 aspartate carbamoyltransferase catalytic subunit [Coriobacteriales bacterium]
MLHHKHLIDIDEYSVEEITEILDTARSFKEVNDRTIKKLPTLRGRTVINLFLEPSTRTRTSFEIAGKRMSADVINFSASSSSTKKGETLADTGETLNAMNADLIVVRSKQEGAPRLLARHVDAHIVNGGDGKHQHPTQALLDAFTIRERLGHLEGLRIGIVGDIAHSRVVGSLVPLLVKLGAKPIVIGPPTLMPSEPGWWGCDWSYTLDDVLPELDVVYMLRIQMERLDGAPLPSLREYTMLYGIDTARLAAMKPEAIIMHPGPINRGVELSAEAADSERAVILDQVNAGVAVRMSVMYLLLGGDNSGLAS